jgi:hypothetical protein
MNFAPCKEPSQSDSIIKVYARSKPPSRNLPLRSVTLNLEWDAFISVYHLMHSIPQLLKLKHLYSHEDSDINFAYLPCDVQMNTQASPLATLELDEFTTSLHNAPFDPKSQVMLCLDGITVTHHLETTIRTKARLPALITYYTRTTSIGMNAPSTLWTETLLAVSTLKCNSVATS